MAGLKRGPKPGSRNKVPKGYSKARILIKKAREAEIEDPEMHEARGVILEIMRGTIKGRYVGYRLGAANRMLDDAIEAKSRGKGGLRGRFVVEFGDGSSVPPSATSVSEEGPTLDGEVRRDGLGSPTR